MVTIKITRGSSIDTALGSRLRQIRQNRNLSQRDVAVRLGVTFQQIQKYEQGQTRISVASLVQISQILNVHPAEVIGSVLSPHASQPTQSDHSDLDDRARALWGRIKHAKHKHLLLDLMISLTEQGDESMPPSTTG